MWYLFEFIGFCIAVWAMLHFVLSRDPWIRAKLNLDKLKARVELTEEERSAIKKAAGKVNTRHKEEMERINQGFDVELERIQKMVNAAKKKGFRYGTKD